MDSTDSHSTTTTSPAKRRRLDVINSDVTSIRELKGSQEKLQHELYRLKSENTRLVAVERANSLTISKLTNENQRLLQKCTDYRIAKQTLKRAKAESQQQVQDCQVEITKLQEEVDRLENKKKSLLQKLKDAREDIDGLQQYARASDQSIAESSHQYQIDVSCLQNKNKALEAKIKSVSANLSTLGRENEALLQQCRDEQHAKDVLKREQDAIQEKYHKSQKALASIRMQLQFNKSQKEGVKGQLVNATKTIDKLQQEIREKDQSIENVKAGCDANLHRLHLQSHKSLLVIQSSNEGLKRRVTELEGMLVEDAQCMKGLFEERDELQRTVLKQHKKTVVLKSEVEDQLRSILQRHQDTLKQVKVQLGKGDSTGGTNQQLIRDKIELQRVVAEMKAKHLEEVEALQEEIEQIKMNHAVELGFLEG